MDFQRYYRSLVYFWLLVSVGLGLLLRSTALRPWPGLEYRNILHAHTHLALLGWMFGGFFLLLIFCYGRDSDRRCHAWMFWLQQLSLVGMLATFPFQGYAAGSIAFSTLFLFVAFSFAAWLWRRLRGEARASAMAIRAALAFLCVSQLGPLALGYFMAKDMGHTHWYPNSVYFYLHFFYNGFFTLALLGLAMRSWEGRLGFPIAHCGEVWALVAAVALSFAGSLLWMQPSAGFYGVALLGTSIQLALLVVWVSRFFSQRKTWARTPGALAFGSWVGAALLAKAAMQAAASVPALAAWAYATAPFTIIGYIHWVMLGVFTPYLLAALYPAAAWGSLAWVGIACYALGFLWTEFLLLGQGLHPELASLLPFYPSLFWGYAALVCGLFSFGYAIGLRPCSSSVD